MKASRLFLWIFKVSVFLSLVFTFPSKAENARDIAKKAFPSVVMLVMQDSAGQPLSLGSGFFVKESVVASNLHVVAGTSKGYAKIIGQKTKYDVMGYVAIDEQRDLILLKVKDANAPVLSFGNSDKVSIGDEIFVIGNPQGLEGTFSKGIVSSIRAIGQDSLLQITAPISPGSSGGPVLNEEGKVIGVAVATFKGGQNLNFAIPVSYLSNLLDNTKSVKPLLTKEKPIKTVKSILSDLGGRNTEGVVGTNLIWEYKMLQSGQYSFSLENKLEEPVTDILCLIVFYDKNNSAIDIDLIQYNGIIPGRLAKRVTSKVDGSVQELTTRVEAASPHTKVEFRILDFQIVEESEEEL